MPKIILKLGDEIIKEFLLGRGAMTIGRKDDNDIQIESKEVSGLHAKLFNYGGNFYIHDMKSLNGTFVNNKRIVKHHLEKGDLINIGQYTLDFELESELPEEVQENTQQPEAESIVTEEPEIEQELQEPESQELVEEEDVSQFAAGLIILSSSKKQSVYPIKKKITTIGIGKDVDIKIKRSLYDPLFMSKTVAIINKKASGYLITPSDIKSVKINDNSLEEPYFLQDGDVVEAGGTKIQFYFNEK